MNTRFEEILPWYASLCKHVPNTLGPLESFIRTVERTIPSQRSGRIIVGESGFMVQGAGLYRAAEPLSGSCNNCAHVIYKRHVLHIP